MSLLKRSWFGKLFGGIELILGLGKGYDATNDVRLTSETLRLLLSGQGVAPTEVFGITIDANTLTGVVSQNVTPHDKWLIKRDDDTAPVSSDMKTGDIDSTVLLPAFGSYTYYLFKEVSGIISEVLNSSGESGVIVTSTDTVSPAFPTNALINLSGELTATEQETQIKFSLEAATDPTPGSGVVGQPYNLNDTTDDSAVLIGIATGAPITVTVGPSFNVDVYGTVDDLSENSGQSNVISLQTSLTVVAGIANIDEPALFSEDDDAATPLQVTLNTTDTVGSPTVTVSTREYDGTNAVAGTRNTFITSVAGIDNATDVITTAAPHGWTDDGLALVYSQKNAANPPVTNATAIGLTDHTTFYARVSTHGSDELSLFQTAAQAIDTASSTGRLDLTASGTDTQSLFDGNFEPKSSELVTFSGGTATVDIELVTRALGSNNMFGFEIDFGSESAGSVGDIPSCLCLINTSAVSGSGSIEPTFDGVDYLYVLNFNDRDVSQPSTTGTLESFTPTIGVTAAVDDSFVTSQATDDYGNTTTLIDTAPYLQMNVSFASADQLFVSARTKTALNSDANNVHMNYDATSGGYTASGSSLLGLRGLTRTDGAWIGQDFSWSNSDGSAARKQFTPAAGEHTFELWGNEPGSVVDSVVLHTDANYDPSLIGDAGEGAFDENYGPPSSSRSTSTVEDNVLNPAQPLNPLPVLTTTPVLSPPDGAMDVSTSTSIVVTLPGFTNIESHQFDVLLAGVKISGTISIVGQSITFVPSVPLAQGTIANPAEFTIEAVGFGFDNTGTARQYDTTGVWTVTTTNTDNTDLVNITFDESGWAAAGLVNASDATPSDSLIVLATDPENPPQIMQDAFHIWKDFARWGDGFQNAVRSTNRGAIVPSPTGRPGNCWKTFHLRGDKVAGPNWRCDLEDDSTGDYKTPTYTELNHDTSATVGGRNYIGWKTYPGYEEVYYSYDYYLDPLFTTTPLQKFHEWMTNWMLQSDHDASVDEFSGVFGITAFKNFSHSVDPTGPKLPLSLDTTYYDAVNTQRVDYWAKDGADPTDPSLPVGDALLDIAGRWRTLEVGFKMNTATDPTLMTEAELWGASPPASALKDGWIKVWMTDPVIGWQGKLVHDVAHIWRRHNRLYVNGWMVRDHMNNTSANPSDLTPTDNRAVYIKNLRVTKTRVTTSV